MSSGVESTEWFEFGRAMVLGLRDQRAGDATDDSADRFAADAAFTGLRASFAKAISAGTSTFSILAANAGTTLAEAEVLAVLAAAEIDPTLHLIVARIQGDAVRNRLTTGSLLEMFASVQGHPGVLAVGPESALRSCGFVRIHHEGPWADHTVALHPSVTWALLGDASRDPELPPILAIVEADVDTGDQLVVVSGADRRRRREAAAEATAGDRFLVITGPEDAAGWEATVREATMTGMGVIVEVDGDALGEAGRRTIIRAGHVPWAISTAIDLPLEQVPDRSWVGVDAGSAPVTDDEWAMAFGADVERTHPLRPDQLDSVARAYRGLGDDLDAAVRRLGSGQLDRLATRIRPQRGWDDLVLPPERKALLHTVIERYRLSDLVLGEWGLGRSASTGTVALFAGSSGTGKTLAAEVIAGELGLDVFKLDLSSVVSKYIGETEKNLEAIFEAAGAGNVVLFFDEADALFGKRSEVKDARDRYANIEVSYLLQRLEAYEGLVIMATNFEKNVDQAFLRRIHVRVEFAVPAAEERLAIWRQLIPPEAPTSDLDLDWIAHRFEIAGGVIKNAVVHAGFIAAAANGKITTETAVLGVAREYRKLGRLIKEAEFDPHFELVKGA